MLLPCGARADTAYGCFSHVNNNQIRRMRVQQRQYHHHRQNARYKRRQLRLLQTIENSAEVVR
jgi:hypothetical protein